MIVTKIEPQKRHPDRCSLFIDGRFVLGLPARTLTQYGVSTGNPISSETVESLRQEEETRAAETVASRFLSRRRHTERDVRFKLADGEFHPAVISRVIDSLKEKGLIDDALYCRAFIHDAELATPAGSRLIASKLRAKGIPQRIVKQAILEAAGMRNETDLATAAARKYARKLAGSRKKLPQDKIDELTKQYLIRRGFEWSVVNTVLREAGSMRESLD